MSRKRLAGWLKVIVFGLAVCGLLIYFLVIPRIGRALAEQNPQFSYCFLPWIIFLWITAIPCYAALAWGWSIACEIGRDRSYSMKNATSLKRIMVAAILDTGVFFIGNVIFLCLNMNHPSILLASMLICVIGTAIAIVAGALSHLVAKAAAQKKTS